MGGAHQVGREGMESSVARPLIPQRKRKRLVLGRNASDVAPSLFLCPVWLCVSQAGMAQ